LSLSQQLLQLVSDENIQFAYLFGSYADDTFTDKSDIDIAVYLDDYSFDVQLSLYHVLEKVLHKDVDLVCLNEVRNIYLLENILNDPMFEGARLYYLYLASDLVSSSLKQTIESIKKENYRRQIEQMTSDPMVIEDIK